MLSSHDMFKKNIFWIATGWGQLKNKNVRYRIDDIRLDQRFLYYTCKNYSKSYLH